MFKFQTVEINQTLIHLLHYDALDLNEHLHCLSATELERLNTFKHEKRKQEFVATRLLKHHYFPLEQIQYDEFGAPYFNSDTFISISHCKGVSAIAMNPTHRIGLDLEWIASKAMILSSKFLNTNEQGFLDTTDEVAMTRAWSAKESLYKLAKMSGVIFKEHLILCSYYEDSDHYFDCEIRNGEIKYSVHLTSRRLDNLIITINSHNLQSF